MNDSLKQFVAVYDDALSPELCADIIKGFEANAEHQRANGAGVNVGLEDSAWTEVNVSSMAEPAFQTYFEQQVMRYHDRYNAELTLSCPISPIEKLTAFMMKCYRSGKGDRFQVHFDSIRQHSNRYLVFLWYLNTVAEGGETWFPQLDLKIEPKAGRLLVFPPYWMFQHAGLSPRSGDKYILSTYAVY